MLKKLLKYDLQNILKILSIFYSLALFFSILTRTFFSIENSFIMSIIGHICSGITISMIFNILINNIIRLWVRFKNNFYGDESYLTHTLPIDKKTLYLSKIISAFITMITSMLVIVATLFIAYYSKENLEIIKNLLIPLVNLYDSTITIILLSFSFILFLEFMNVLQSGFTGIILGHKMNNIKTGYSVLYGFITFLTSQIFLISIMFLIALFNKDLMNIFMTSEIISVEAIKTVIYIAISLYTILIFVIYFINIKLFKKGVNVD